jgi:predicted nuclease with TOPRIM domain
MERKMFDQKDVFEQLKAIFDEDTALRLTQVFASVFAPVEALARHETRLDRIDRSLDGINAALDRIVAIGERTDKRLEELAAAQARTEEVVAGLSARFDTLAAAQARTEEKLEALTGRVDNLTAAQARTEQVVAGLSARFDTLAAAQARTEEKLEALTGRVDNLTAAQARTEEVVAGLSARFDTLAAAQARTEEKLEALTGRVDNLTAAQARTEEVVAGLGIELKRVRQELGGLSHTVGYDLENRAYVSLPHILGERFNIIPDEPLYRRFITDKDGKPLEANVYAAARRDNETIRVVGEAKSQLSKNAVEEFLRKRIDRLPEAGGKLFPLLITHMISEPDVEEYARERGIELFYSYEL